MAMVEQQPKQEPQDFFDCCMIPGVRVDPRDAVFQKHWAGVDSKAWRVPGYDPEHNSAMRPSHAWKHTESEVNQGISKDNEEMNEDLIERIVQQTLATSLPELSRLLLGTVQQSSQPGSQEAKAAESSYQPTELRDSEHRKPATAEYQPRQQGRKELQQQFQHLYLGKGARRETGERKVQRH